MKRQSFVYILLLAMICVMLLSLRGEGGSQVNEVNVTVYGKSNTGFSWARTYMGDLRVQKDFVADLQESYIRLAESMGAGSEIKIFSQGLLIAEENYEGKESAPYSGLQMTVHDQFADRYNYTTIDAQPSKLAEMETAVEPFVCGGEPR